MSYRPLPPEEHSPHCPEPEFEWQAVIIDGLPRRGRCIHCGAIKISRPAGRERARTWRGDAA